MSWSSLGRRSENIGRRKIITSDFFKGRLS